MPGGREKADLLLRLRDEIALRERSEPVDRSLAPTGWPALDRLLPGGGVRRGTVVELLDRRCGCGAETVAAVLTRAACRSPGMAVVVDRDGQFYPPALVAWGVPFERQVVVRAESDADALWAADQALRSRAAAAVWLRTDRLAPHDARRLQLSAEQGGAVGLLFRPALLRGRPTCAEVQLAVEPQPGDPLRGYPDGRRLRVELTRCRGGTPGAAAVIDLNDETGEVWEGVRHAPPTVPAAAALADPAAAG